MKDIYLHYFPGWYYIVFMKPIFFLFALLISGIVYAQLDTEYDVLDSNLYNAKNKTQLIDYKNYLNIFPPKPRDGWEVGMQAGIVNIIGDVSSQLTPLGVGVSVRKSLGHIISVRGQYTFGITKGRNNFPTFDFANDASYQRYNGNIISGVYRSYRTIVNSIGLQSLFDLTNINYHGVRKKFHVYSLIGLQFLFYKSKVDALNGNNLYNFDAFDVRQFDGSYETDADVSHSAGLGLSLGAGIQYFLAPNVNLQLENSYTFTSRHDMDGSKYTGVNNPTFQSNNGVNYLSFGVNIILKNKKKQVDPLWLQNPLAYIYKQLNSPRAIKIPEPKLKDTDGDGVADLFDKEPGTLPGVPVDAKGITLDTDGDGVPDYIDAELITPTSCRPVDEKGVGTCPVKSDTCCGTLKNYVDRKLNELGTIPPPPSEPKSLQNTPHSVQQEQPIEKDSDTTKTPTIPSENKHIADAGAPIPVPVNPKGNATPIETLDDDCANAHSIALLGEKILFEINTANLLPLSLLYLEDIIKIIKRKPDYALAIIPKVMTFENNISSLFKRRKQVIYEYLVEQGLPKNKVITDLADTTHKKTFVLLLNKKEISGCASKPQKPCYDARTAQLISQDKTYGAFSNKLFSFSKNITFTPNQAAFNEISTKALVSIAGLLKQNPKYTVIIMAPYEFGDETEQGKKDLSEKRGNIIKEWLIQKGIEGNRLKVLGLNTYQPLRTVPLMRVFFPNQDSDNDCVTDDQDECPTLEGILENKGCMVSVAMQDTLNIIMKNIYFLFDKYTISTPSLPYLDTLSQIMKKYTFDIVVAGSTDTTGNPDYNLDLSFERAKSIKKYLISKGIQASRIQALGLGERKSRKGTETELRRNRRVEVWIKY